MKRFAILAIFAALGAGAAIFFSKETHIAKENPVFKVENELTSDRRDDKFDSQLESAIAAIAALKSQNHEMLEQLDGNIAALSKRITELENTEALPQNEDTEYLDYQDHGNPELTEKGFAHWLDSSLGAEQQDAEKTGRITNETLTALSKNLPDVNLDSMNCSKGYCRASFSHINGQKPETRKLFGEPPFMGQGFTVVEPDGRVLLYFTEADQSLAELKLEANIAAQMGFIEN